MIDEILEDSQDYQELRGRLTRSEVLKNRGKSSTVDSSFDVSKK